MEEKARNLRAFFHTVLLSLICCFMHHKLMFNTNIRYPTHKRQPTQHINVSVYSNREQRKALNVVNEQFYRMWSICERYSRVWIHDGSTRHHGA